MIISSQETVIGFVGTGVMGKSMASHLMGAGFQMHIYTRTKSKADDLIEKGAVWQNSPAQVAAAADVVITIVGYPKDVEEVYLGEGGILENCKMGNIVIDMTTSSQLPMSSSR